MRLASVLTYRANGGLAQHQPAYPEGFPPRMLVYNWFARLRGWNPRIVDELTLEEIEWLPVVEEALQLAAEQLKDD